MSKGQSQRPRISVWIRRLTVFGPGLLVAATGVGVGDLATASIVGSRLGVAVLWAVLIGAMVKYVLNEGLARWQLATGTTLLEGVVRHLGRPAAYFFLVYLLIWSFAVGRALVSACGVTAHALAPVFDDPLTGKIVFGVIHSLAGVALVLVGGFRLFEKLMSISVALLFVTVIATALLLHPELSSIARGALVPTIPAIGEGGLILIVALLGGVGGTVTLLCYGYWIREVGRDGPQALSLCRWDLATGYAATALFGMAMVVVGAQVPVAGGGAALLVDLAQQLEVTLGNTGRALFLVGAWSAVASSLLGVWQSVPYLFADLWRLVSDPDGRSGDAVNTRGFPYRAFLVGLGLVSVAGLFGSFVRIQVVYGVLGALFVPMLAIALLVLNGRQDLLGALRNGPLARLVLLGAVCLFLAFSYLQIR
jgi:Mn2+/Fe2+ NRAMP family transporter